MYKVLRFLIFSFFVFLLVSTAAFSEEIKIYFNGDLLDFSLDPVEKKGRIYVPLRDIVDKMEGEASWHALSQTIIVFAGDKEINFRTGFRQAKVNGEWVPLAMPALRIDEIVFVPLRFLAETFGAEVTWNKEENTAFIEYEIIPRKSPLFELTHNAFLPLSLGETFVATFKGPDEGKAFIRATDYEDNSVFFTMSMEKKSSGLYEASYEVSEGDILKGGKLVVTYIDSEGNKKFIKADRPVYINTEGPVIKKVVPGEKGFACEDFSAVYIIFDLEEGSMIDGSTLFFSVDSKNVSSQALITNNMVLYKLPSPLDVGEHSATLRVSDKSGNEIEKDWIFWVVTK